MYSLIDDYNYVAVVYYASLDCAFFGNDIFDIKSQVFHNAYNIDSRYDLDDICNELVKKGNCPVAIDLYYSDCTLDCRYKVIQVKNKFKLSIWKNT